VCSSDLVPTAFNASTLPLERKMATSPNRDFSERVRDWGISGEFNFNLGEMSATSMHEEKRLTSADRAVPGWTRYIDALMKRHPRLGSCLMTGLPELDEAAGCLRVVFATDKKFMVDSIAGETGKLAELAAAQWGRPLKVLLEHGPRGQQVDVAEEIRQEVAPTHREELRKACAVDPALGDLVDLLGGQPLPESERQRWDPPAR